MRRSRKRIVAAALAATFLGVAALGIGNLAAVAVPPDPAGIPVIDSPIDGSATGDTTPAISFDTLETGYTVTVLRDGFFYCSADTGGLSNGSCSGGALPFGQYEFTASADYTATPGFPSGPSASITLTIYSTDPVTILSEPAASSTDATPTWTGSGPTSGSVQITSGGSPLCNTSINSFGGWTCTAPAQLPQTFLTVQAGGLDQGGDPVVADTGIDFTVQPPPTPTILVTQGPQTGQTQPEVQGSKDAQTSEITVLWTQDFVTFNFYCNVSGGIGSTLWACPVPNGTPLPVGNSSFIVNARSEAGSQSADSAPVPIAVFPNPVIVTPSTGTHTNDPTPSFSGTALGGSTTVQVRTSANDIVCFPVVVVGGNWVCESGFFFPDGVYQVRAIAGPATNNESVESQLTIDTVAPGAPTITGPGTLNGPILEYSTANPTVTVQGFAEAFAEIDVYVDGSPTPCVGGLLIADSDGLWACELDTFVALGTYGIAAAQIDLAGNPGPASAETLEVTRTALVPPVNQPVFTNPAPGPDPDAQPTIEGDIGLETGDVDVVVTVTNSEGTSVYCNDTDITPSPTAFFSCNGPILPYGDNTFTARTYFSAADPGHTTPGPVSAELVYTRFGMDAVNVTSTPPLTPLSTTEARLDFAGTGPELGTLEVYRMEPGSPRICEAFQIPATGLWSCEGSPLPTGTYDLMVVATDQLGNATFDGPFTVQIDPPTVAINQDSIPAPYVTDYAWPIQGTMSEDVELVEILSSTNPAGPFTLPYCSVTNNNPGLTLLYCVPPDNSGLVLGNNYLAARVTNAAGVQSAFSTPIVQTLVASPVILSPAEFSWTNDPTPTLSGTADDTYFDTITVGDGPEGELFMCDAIVQPDDTWQCTSVGLEDGNYTPFALTTPFAIYGGRTDFVIDTVPPVPPVIDPVSTTDTTPTITGTGDYEATITLYIDGAFVPCASPAIVNEGGVWECALVAPLSVGTHDVAARQVDRAGNVSPISVATPTLVITPVLIPIVPPPPPEPTATPTPTPAPTTPPIVLLVLNWVLGGASGEYAPGDSVTLTGTGLPVGAIANAEIHSTPQQLGTAMVDASGAFQIDATIPDDIEPGAHTIVVSISAAGAEPSVIEQAVMVVVPAEQKGTIPKSDGGEKLYDGGSIDGEGGTVDRNAPNAPSSMTSALDTVLDIIGNPIVIASAAAIGLGLLLFVAVPAELLNATLSEQYGRFTKRIPRLRTAPGWWAALKAMLTATPVVGAIAITLLTSVIFGFADPRFGFDLTSLRVVLACALGLLVVGFIANALTGIVVAKRWRLSTRMEIKPLGIILAVAGVLLSRLLEFSPGFLIGLLLGIVLVGSVGLRDEVRTTLTRSGILFGFAIIAWVVYSFTSGSLVDQSFGSNLFLETMVAITTEGLTALVIGLLPFKFLEGESLWKFSKPLWVGIWIFVAAVFALIVVPNNFAQVNGSLWIWGIVVAGFALVAIGLYVYFRFFAPPIEEDDSVPEHERVGSRR